MISPACFQLRKLKVFHRGRAVYDQSFHSGLNIISGENGSGKSTIADFIFYSLGGEFEAWKTVASHCDLVQAEIVTKSGVITIRREVDRSLSPASVFYGSMVEAEKHGADGWQIYPIRRTEGRESLSQIMFRASGIPEARSQSASNITMHQILRILYADQRTPAAFLFRYESFDTREIREAVGDLLCGFGEYELYELELELRALNKKYNDASDRLSGLIDALPSNDSLVRVEDLQELLGNLNAEVEHLTAEIGSVDALIDRTAVREFAKERSNAIAEITKIKEKLTYIEGSLETNELEQVDLQAFVEHLQKVSSTVLRTQQVSSAMGNIEFVRCPACLAELSADRTSEHCVVCGRATDPEQERSRYLQIKFDIDAQIRESLQLLDDKGRERSRLQKDLGELKRYYQQALTSFTMKFEVANSPRDSFLAERHQRIGQIEIERRDLDRLMEIARRISILSDEKASLQAQISRLKDRQKALEDKRNRRRTIALTSISELAKKILKLDLERQEEFRRAQVVTLNFGDNSVQVDGELNFAESSNVIVKNTAILALLIAATEDIEFFHPRFVLLDNIEDKGMEQKRSHNFQEIIASLSKKASMAHQIILTTSMLSPELDREEYVIGPHYTHDRHTLDIVE